jgi:biotin synthase
VKMVAIARITMPKSAVRLSAGRLELTDEGQAFCFMAGANSIFAGETLLTTPNPEFKSDMMLFKTLGLTSKKAFADGEQPTSKTMSKTDVKKDGILDPEKAAMETKVKEWKKEMAKN